MEDIKERKQIIRDDVTNIIGAFSANERSQKNKMLSSRLFEFANFIESNIVLLYMSLNNEFNTSEIIRKSLDNNKIVALPAFDTEKHEMKLMKVNNIDKDLKPGPKNILEPNPNHCKIVPLECIGIAIIPGIAFDGKGGRIGSGEGYYDRLIPKLPITTRKVSLAYEDQIIQMLPMEPHDKHVDIIITEKRVIYKI